LEGETNNVNIDVIRFFADYPQQLDSFKAIAQLIDSIGPSALEVKKPQISWGTKYKFAAYRQSGFNLRLGQACKK